MIHMEVVGLKHSYNKNIDFIEHNDEKTPET